MDIKQIISEGIFDNFREDKYPELSHINTVYHAHHTLPHQIPIIGKLRYEHEGEHGINRYDRRPNEKTHTFFDRIAKDIYNNHHEFGDRLRGSDIANHLKSTNGKVIKEKPFAYNDTTKHYISTIEPQFTIKK